MHSFKQLITIHEENKINKLTVLKSGLNFKSHENTYFSLDAIGYRHLAIQNGEQWEYIYPRLNYKISDIEDDILMEKFHWIINLIIIKI